MLQVMKIRITLPFELAVEPKAYILPPWMDSEGSLIDEDISMHLDCVAEEKNC